MPYMQLPMTDAATPHTFDATAATFEDTVIRSSLKTPVLVNFWAAGFEPCETLSPLLEKFATDYNGAFLLAKVDAQQEQELASAFQIRSVPTVMLVKDGQLVDGFPGALPESQLKEFLTHHGIEPTAAVETDSIEVAAPPVDPHAEVMRLRKAIEAAPDQPELKLDLALALLQTGAAAESEHLLDAQPTSPPTTAPSRRAPISGLLLCCRTHRQAKSSRPQLPPIPATCVRAICWVCANWSRAMPKAG
jgi:putative thioredoxin